MLALSVCSPDVKTKIKKKVHWSDSISDEVVQCHNDQPSKGRFVKRPNSPGHRHLFPPSVGFIAKAEAHAILIAKKMREVVVQILKESTTSDKAIPADKNQQLKSIFKGSPDYSSPLSAYIAKRQRDIIVDSGASLHFAGR